MCLQYNTIQLYCQVTNAHGMCYGTKHTRTRTHTSHIKNKKNKKTNYNSQIKPQLNVDIKEQPLCGYIVQIVDVKILVTKK